MGIYLSAPKTDKVSEDGENDRLRYGTSSMQGWRSTMEDAHAALPDFDGSTSFFGVYDGHGGKAVANFCAKYLHQQVLKDEAYLTGDLGTSLQKAFLRMDEMMRGQRGWRELAVLGDKIDKVSGLIEGFIFSPKSVEAKRGAFNDQVGQWSSEEGPHSDFDGPNSGSTACVAVIRNKQLVVANAGDSRCVISRKGQAYNLSKDHKPDIENEKDRILKAGGFIQVGRVNGSLNLARAIGDAEFKQNKQLPVEKQIVTANPDITSVELCDDDEFLVIACDGIWDCMSSQQLVDYVLEQLKRESKLSVICERAFERCLAPSSGGEGCDNMTMILVQFKKPIVSADSVGNQPKPVSSADSVGNQPKPVNSAASVVSQPKPVSVGKQPKPVNSAASAVVSADSVGNQPKPVSSVDSIGNQPKPVNSAASKPVNSAASVVSQPKPVSVGNQPKPVNSAASAVGNQPKPVSVGNQPKPISVGNQPKPIYVGNQAKPINSAASAVGNQPKPVSVGNQPSSSKDKSSEKAK